MSDQYKTVPRKSWTFDDYTNSEIRRAAETGIYDIRGGGSKKDYLILMIYFFLVPLCRDTLWRVIGRNALQTLHLEQDMLKIHSNLIFPLP